MYTTIQISTPDSNLFEADVPLDLPVSALLRQFTEMWQPASVGPAKRFILHRKRADGPPLAPTQTLRESGITSLEKFFLLSEQLEPSAPVGLTIEDSSGQHYTTAVLLNTSLRQLANSFLSQKPGKGEPIVELIDAENRPLSIDQTLYEAGVNDNSTLRIYRKSLTEEKE